MARRLGGRQAKQGRRDAIHNAMAKHGDVWRDHLSEIFNELDSEEVSLGAYQAREIDLGAGQSAKVYGSGPIWTSLKGKQLRQIVDALRKYADSRIEFRQGFNFNSFHLFPRRRGYRKHNRYKFNDARRF